MSAWTKNDKTECPDCKRAMVDRDGNGLVQDAAFGCIYCGDLYNFDEDTGEWCKTGLWSPYLTQDDFICDKEGCNQRETRDYRFPDGKLTYLCDEHAKGMFCLGCGVFTGGTEEIFQFGAYECSECHESDDDNIVRPYEFIE